MLRCCIGYNVYGAYCIPLSSRHRPAAQAILAGRVWEPGTIRLLAENCEGGDIVHAGTYFGDFLPALSQAVGAHHKVWAFEPNPENYRCADITLRINNLANVVLRNTGLGHHTEQKQMIVFDKNGRSLGGYSHIATAAGGGHLTVPVNIISIDEAVPSDSRVAVIQLDIEGFELQALKGAIATIERCRPLLVIETLPEDAELMGMLQRMGYRVTGRCHENFVMAVAH